MWSVYVAVVKRLRGNQEVRGSNLKAAMEKENENWIFGYLEGSLQRMCPNCPAGLEWKTS